MSPENILAIDNGTQSVRALLFDPKGNLLAKSQVPFEPYYSVTPGWAEQDPMVFWNSLCEACQRLWAQPDVSKDSISAVTLTTQRATVVLVDQDGAPIRPAISWLDQRRTEGLRPIRGLWGLAFRLAGATETAAYLQAEAEASWIREHEPEHWENHHKYLFLSGFLTHMLVGEFIDSVGSQVGYLPFDYKAQTWSKSYDWKWQAVPLPKEKLSKLVKPAAKLGEITPKASEATGIPAGMPMIAAAADKACEVIGSGCYEPHIGSLSYGTTATINTTHKKYIEVIPLIPPYPAAVPGYYTMEISVYRGYWMVSWFKQEFGLLEQQLADKEGVQPEELFDDLVHAVPPGSQGLVLQPYWSPGLRLPGPEARGAVIGFSDFHTRAHLYRAILEGLAYALREGAERTTKRTGVPITELRVAGGGSQSNAAMQLTADIFGLPTYRPHTYEASGLGAAIDGAVGMGIHPNFATAVKEMTHLGDGFEPDPKAQKIYDQLYHEVYSKMYKSLRPLYHTIRHITKNHE
jgi:sugar (pentulose or hexulose) kinase